MEYRMKEKNEISNDTNLFGRWCISNSKVLFQSHFRLLFTKFFLLFWGRKLCRNQDNRQISSLERNLFIRKIQNKTNDKVSHYGNSGLTITSFFLTKKILESKHRSNLSSPKKKTLIKLSIEGKNKFNVHRNALDAMVMTTKWQLFSELKTERTICNGYWGIHSNVLAFKGICRCLEIGFVLRVRCIQFIVGNLQ